MEASQPEPVVFKSIIRSGEEADNVLKLTYCNIEFYQPDDEDHGCYLLKSHSDPFNPLQLYKSSMNKLLRNLDMAFKEMKKMEEEPLEEDALYDCGVINAHGKLVVQLGIKIFHGNPNLWLRLYGYNDKDQLIPTKFGVRFSPSDSLADIKAFINKK